MADAAVAAVADLLERQALRRLDAGTPPLPRSKTSATP
jgi:hypothetical protein